MIFELFFLPLILLVRGLLTVLPIIVLPADFLTAVSSFFVLISTVAYFIPLDTFFVVVTILLALNYFGIVWGMINWIIKKIPGMS